MRRIAIAALVLAAWPGPGTAAPRESLGKEAYRCLTKGEAVDIMEETGKLMVLLDREIPRARRTERAAVRREIEGACLESGAEADWCRRIVLGGDAALERRACLEDGLDPDSCGTVSHSGTPGEEEVPR
jgi:hypothetical protein